MKAAREQMKALMSNNNSSSEELRQKHQQLQSLRQQMAERRFDTMLQIREELTPEQRSKMAELKPKFGGRRGKFRQQ